MQTKLGWLLMVGCLVAAAAAAPADEIEIPRDHHAWARFPEGSWKRVRVVTQQYDAQGKTAATSITETKTTLANVGSDSFSLKIESTVEVAGRKLVSEPRTVEQQFNGALAGQTADVRLLGEETIAIEGKKYTCKVQQYEITGSQTRTSTKTYYTPRVAPYVLRRQSKTIDLATKALVGQTLVEVKAIGVPVEILGKTHSAARVRIEQKHAKGREVTDAISSLEVPGGIVSHESREYDDANKLLTSSKLELLEFHIAAMPEQTHSRIGLPRPWQRAALQTSPSDDCAPRSRWRFVRFRQSRREPRCD